MMFRIAPASLAVLAIFNVASTLANGDFKVNYFLKPLWAVISSPSMDYGGSGCGHTYYNNKKCTCNMTKTGQLQMKGEGSIGTATGLTFSCKFKVKTVYQDPVECSVYVDIPYVDDNNISCSCQRGGYEFFGCDIPEDGHDFSKTILFFSEDRQLDEPRCEPLPPPAPSSPPSPPALPEIVDCSGLTDSKKCKIKVKKCKKNLSSLTKCGKKCQKDRNKKKPLCQMTCCKLGFLSLSA